MKKCCWRIFAIEKQKKLHSAGQWFDEVAIGMYLPTYHQQTD